MLKRFENFEPRRTDDREQRFLTGFVTLAFNEDAQVPWAYWAKNCSTEDEAIEATKDQLKISKRAAGHKFSTIKAFKPESLHFQIWWKSATDVGIKFYADEYACMNDRSFGKTLHVLGTLLELNVI